MNSIQNLWGNPQIRLNRIDFACISIVTAIALPVIKLITSSGGIGSTTTGVLASLSLSLLSMVLIRVCCKQEKALPFKSEPLKVESPGCLEDSSASEKLDPGSLLPGEMCVLIFSYLSVDELAKSCLVCKQWNVIAATSQIWNAAIDLKEFFPSLRVFDELDWRSHFNLSQHDLTVDDVPGLAKRALIPTLKKYLSLSVEGDLGFTFLTIPKGLTLNKLIKMAGLPLQGWVTSFSHTWIEVLKELGDFPVEQTYKFLITNNVFEESRCLAFNDQEKLVHELGFAIPHVLEIASLLVVTYTRSQERFYSDRPETCTRCSEKLGGWQVTAGNFSPAGINIDHGFDLVLGKYGAGGVIRFF